MKFTELSSHLKKLFVSKSISCNLEIYLMFYKLFQFLDAVLFTHFFLYVRTNLIFDVAVHSIDTTLITLLKWDWKVQLYELEFKPI